MLKLLKKRYPNLTLSRNWNHRLKNSLCKNLDTDGLNYINKYWNMFKGYKQYLILHVK